MLKKTLLNSPKRKVKRRVRNLSGSVDILPVTPVLIQSHLRTLFAEQQLQKHFRWVLDRLTPCE
jgi:hypothetical protein